jgi:hypothetical protein
VLVRFSAHEKFLAARPAARYEARPLFIAPILPPLPVAAHLQQRALRF